MDHPQKQKEHEARYTRMHYATMTALIIANICNLALATLFATMYGRSLGYASYQIETQSIRVPGAHAMQRVTADGPGSPVSKVSGSGGTSPRTRVVVRFTAHVSWVSDTEHLTDGSVALNTPVSGTYTYLKPVVDSDASPDIGFYNLTGPFSMIVGNYNISPTRNYGVQVVNMSWDRYEGRINESPLSNNWILSEGLLNFTDANGQALSSDRLAESLNLDLFNSKQVYLNIRDANPMPYRAWQMTAVIDSITFEQSLI